MRKLSLTVSLGILYLSTFAQDTVNSTASYYHSKFNGRKTANGDIYCETKMTAASNNYPLNTKLWIINKKTGQKVMILVNDRMAKNIKNRIDLSKAAYRKIADLRTGIQKIQITHL